MKKLTCNLFKCLAVFAASLLLIPAVHAQKDSITDIDIYRGESVSQKGITLSSWGSGEVGEVTDVNYNGSESLKIITQGFFQGACLTFKSPINFKPQLADSTSFLQFFMKLPEQKKNNSPYRGGRYNPYAGNRNQPGNPTRNQGNRIGENYYGDNNQSQTQLVKTQPLKTLRFVLITDDNKQCDFTMLTDDAKTVSDQWVSFAIPIQAIPGLSDSSANVKEIRIFGDSSATLYLGEIRILHDSTPIHIDQQSDLTIAVNDTVNFTASADAGPTLLKYQWNFGIRPGGPDANGMLPADAEGKAVTCQYKKSGDYVCTLTVSDAYGLKKPAVTKINVHVTL
jgi:hypothetical protein